VVEPRWRLELDRESTYAPISPEISGCSRTGSHTSDCIITRIGLPTLVECEDKTIRRSGAYRKLPRPFRVRCKLTGQRAEIDIDYLDTTSLSLSTSLLINFPRPRFAVLPVSLGVQLASIGGTVSFPYFSRQKLIAR
jgi:hypothetical protein